MKLEFPARFLQGGLLFRMVPKRIGDMEQPKVKKERRRGGAYANEGGEREIYNCHYQSAAGGETGVSGEKLRAVLAKGGGNLRDVDGWAKNGDRSPNTF